MKRSVSTGYLIKIVYTAFLSAFILTVSGCGTALKAILPDQTYICGSEPLNENVNEKIIKNLCARYFAQSPGDYVTTPYTGTKILVDIAFGILPVPPIMELDLVRFTIHGITENDAATLEKIREQNSNVTTELLGKTTIEVAINAYGGNFSRKEVGLLLDNIQKSLNLQFSYEAEKTYKKIFSESYKINNHSF